MKAKGQGSAQRECTPKLAVTQFLAAMKRAARNGFPAWAKILNDGIEDCGLDSDGKRAILEVQPLEDYYFAAVVALEASRIKKLFPARAAARLLSEIGDQVDGSAGRHDRLVSDFVFAMVVHLGSDDPRRQAMPYDDVVLHLLRRLQIDAHPGTRHLMTMTLFRHQLGEPLALGVPQWWMKFHATFLLQVEEIPPESTAPAMAPAMAVTPRRRVASPLMSRRLV